jgi:hypothetical protein
MIDPLVAMFEPVLIEYNAAQISQTYGRSDRQH